MAVLKKYLVRIPEGIKTSAVFFGFFVEKSEIIFWMFYLYLK